MINRMKNPMAQVCNENQDNKQKWRFFVDDYWVKEFRHSEKNSDEN